MVNTGVLIEICEIYIFIFRNQDINTADSVALNLPVITDKNMFLLPKALSGGDSFTIQGLIQDNPKMYVFIFLTDLIINFVE